MSHSHDDHHCCSHVRLLEPQDLCACGSQQHYQDCCLPFIQGQRLPETPAALMRSRYTAYTQALVDYIANTMCGPAAQGFDQEESAHWAHHIVWQGLEILDTTKEGNEGTVTFAAHYEYDGKPHVLQENSLFRRIRGRWFYVDQVKPDKIGRNDPCHCGSGKKYKKCCALHSS